MSYSDSQQVLPGWLADGKGLRGDAVPVSEQGLSFPPAQVTEIEAQVPLSNAPLANPGGGGIPGTPHAYTVQDASSGGATKVTVTPGNHLDTTNNRSSVPTIDGTAITASPAPKLGVSSSDTVVYFKLTVVPLDGSGRGTPGQITAIEIDAGPSLPATTATAVYQVLDYVTVEAGKSVSTRNAGVSGSQVTQPCLGTLLFGSQ